MGNSQSRQQSVRCAKDAYESALDLRDEFPGPRMRGAIVAYCEGRINFTTLIQHCTRLEVYDINESALMILSC